MGRFAPEEEWGGAIMAMVCRRSCVLLVSVLLVAAGSLALGAQTYGLPAQVETNDGRTILGDLLGLTSPIRLDASAFGPSVGPDQAYDIPVTGIRQITVDFPRVVVEAGDRVFIGPFSAFRGIAQRLTLHHAGQDLPLYTTALRRIALNGEAIHPVPYEWLGDGFLSLPAILKAPGLEAASVPAGPASVPSSSTVSPTLDFVYPEPPLEAPAETPWWVTLLLVVGVLVVGYFLLGTGG